MGSLDYKHETNISTKKNASGSTSVLVVSKDKQSSTS